MDTQNPTAEPSRAAIDGQPGPLVLEFGTGWCSYCQAARPAIEATLAQYPEVRHLKVEDGRGRPLGRSFAVKLWPTLIFLDDGREAARVVRPSQASEIEAALHKISRRS